VAAFGDLRPASQDSDGHAFYFLVEEFAMSLMLDVERYRRDRAMERSLEIEEASVVQRECLTNEMRRQTALLLDDTTVTEDIADEISRMAAVADWALPSIVEHLASTAERLGGVAQMLANPTENAAAEFYRRGCYALTSGWLEEAEADLLAAVNVYPYNPRTWFNLGIARQRSGSNDSAAEAYSRCARYGVANEPALTARAVLLAAFMHRTAQRPDASSDILRDYADRLDRCAELHLAAGVHHNDHDHLVRAFSLEPEMVVDARSARASGIEQAAKAVCEMPDSPVHRLRAIEQLAAHLADSAHRAGFDSVRSAPNPISLPAPGADALLLANRALPGVMHAIDRLTAQIRNESRQRQNAADTAKRESERSRGEVSRTVETTQQMKTFARDIAVEILQADQMPEQALRRAEEASLAAELAREKAERAQERAQEQVRQCQEPVGEADERARQAQEQAKQAQERARLARAQVGLANPKLRAVYGPTAALTCDVAWWVLDICSQ
jgi:tetratricopeptide (TPR) repeat protein